MENPEIPWRIQMERFIPVEITFFPFLPKRPKFSVPFVWITVFSLVGVLWRTKHNTIDAILIQWHANKWQGILQLSPIPLLFSVPKKYQFHLTENVYRNFHTNGKRSRGASLASLVPIVEKWSLNALESSWFCISIVFSFNWGHFNS